MQANSLKARAEGYLECALARRCGWRRVACRREWVRFHPARLIDFNVDFDSCPPMAEAVAVLQQRYPNATVREPDGDHQVTYRFGYRQSSRTIW